MKFVERLKIEAIMVILCDTSSILMLLRIAPEMFTDHRYECKTIREVHDEIVQTTKFKTKYPWTREVRDRIRVTVLTEPQKRTEQQYHEIIKSLNYAGTMNKKTGKIFDLSRVDMKVISHCIALGYSITSGDNDLKEFISQEFEENDNGSLSPLEIIIQWIEKNLIKWDQEKQKVIDDWGEIREHPQPAKAKRRFIELTGNKYTGS
jgi:hypothetical protein